MKALPAPRDLSTATESHSPRGGNRSIVWPGRREQPALTFPEKTIYGVRASSATRFFACVFFKCPAAERAGRGGPLFLRKTHRSRAVRVSDAALTQNFVRRKGLPGRAFPPRRKGKPHVRAGVGGGHFPPFCLRSLCFIFCRSEETALVA